MEWKIGEIAVSGFITVVLGLIYGTLKTESDVAKGWIAFLVGIVFGYLFMLYKAVPFSIQSAIEYLFTGAQLGLTSIGLYRLTRRDV